MYSVLSLNNLCGVPELEELTLIDIVRLGNIFNFKSLLIVSILELSRDMCWYVCTQALLKTTGADDDCSLGGAFDRQIRR